MNDKNVLVLSIDFPPSGGGMSRHCYDTVKALSAAGFKVTVIALEAQKDNFIEGNREFTLLRLKGLTSDSVFERYVSSVWAFTKAGMGYLLRHRVCCIVANTWTVAGVAAWLIKIIIGIPYVVFAHGLDLSNPQGNKKVSFLMRRVLSAAAQVLAISNFTKGLVRAQVPAAKISLMHPCIDPERSQRHPDPERSEGEGSRMPSDSSPPFLLSQESMGAQNDEDRAAAQNDAAQIRRRFPGKKIILTVARLVEHKGQDKVIAALSRVRKEYAEVVYLVVGSGPFEHRLKAMAAQNGLSDIVFFEGEVKEDALVSYYQSCDIFIMASRQIKDTGAVEGFGITFLEAGICSKPVIAGNSGGVPDVVIDGETGILVDADSSPDIAAALIRLLSDPGLAQSLGAGARRRILKEFTLEQHSRRLSGFIAQYGVRASEIGRLKKVNQG